MTSESSTSQHNIDFETDLPISLRSELGALLRNSPMRSAVVEIEFPHDPTEVAHIYTLATNDKLQGFLGYTKKPTESIDLMELVHEDDQAYTEAHLIHSIHENGPVKFTPRLRGADERYRAVEMNLQMTEHEGRLLGIVHMSDVTVSYVNELLFNEQKRSYDNFPHLLQETLQTLNEVMHYDQATVVFLHDDEQTIENTFVFHPGVPRLFKHILKERENIHNRPLFVESARSYNPINIDDIGELSPDIWTPNPEARGKHLRSLMICPLRNGKDKLLGFIILRDFEPGHFNEQDELILKETSQILAHGLGHAHRAYQLTRNFNEMHINLAKKSEEAITDKLTGLYNRRALDDLIADRKRDSRRGNERAVVMIDIDHFKAINDAFEHDGGDEVLKAFASILRLQYRDVDFVCRWGGEEFVIVMYGEEMSSADIIAAAHRFSQAFTNYMKSTELRVGADQRIIHARYPESKWKRWKKEKRDSGDLTVSVGVSLVDPVPNLDLNKKIREADQALIYAKNHGRHQVVLYDDSMKSINTRKKL